MSENYRSGFAAKHNSTTAHSRVRVRKHVLKVETVMSPTLGPFRMAGPRIRHSPDPDTVKPDKNFISLYVSNEPVTVSEPFTIAAADRSFGSIHKL